MERKRKIITKIFVESNFMKNYVKLFLFKQFYMLVKNYTKNINVIKGKVVYWRFLMNKQISLIQQEMAHNNYNHSNERNQINLSIEDKRQLEFIKNAFAQSGFQANPFLMEIDYSVINQNLFCPVPAEVKQILDSVKDQVLEHTFHFLNKGNVYISYYINKIPCYVKSGLSRDQVDKYLFLDQLGIGTKILSYSYPEKAVVMEAGISLLQFVGRCLVYPFFTDSILKQINYIQIKLKESRIAHCDIKPDNMIITYNQNEGLRVKLIDNELAVSFGQRRLVGTPQINIFPNHQIFLVDENTDSLGFLYVKNFVLLRYIL